MVNNKSTKRRRGQAFDAASLVLTLGCIAASVIANSWLPIIGLVVADLLCSLVLPIVC